MLEPGHGSRVTRSTILARSGRVGSQVSVTDPVSDPVFLVFFYTRSIVAFGDEENTPRHLWDVYSVFSRRDLYVCCIDQSLLAESIHQ